MIYHILYVMSVLCVAPATFSIIYILKTMFYGQVKEKFKSFIKISIVAVISVVCSLSFAFITEELTNYDEITKDAQLMINDSDIWLDEKTNEFFILEENMETIRVNYNRVYIDKKLYKELDTYAN